MYHNVTVTPLDDGSMVKVSGRCVVTKSEYSVVIPTSGYYEYLRGGLVQKCFPDLPAEQREFLITGISPQGWDKMFGYTREEFYED